MNEPQTNIPAPKAFKFWRWVLRFYGRIIFYTAFVGVLTYYVGIPTWEGIEPRNELLDALEEGTEVRLEEFVFGQVTVSNKLSSDVLKQVRDAMPFRLRLGSPGLILFCFSPHHRVVVVRKDGTVYSFEVCFHCAMTKSIRGPEQTTGPSMAPHEWMESLRELFIRNGV